MFIHTAKRHISKKITNPHPSSLLATCFCVGLPKSSEQAYIEFESIEAIVKTASRTKFFIEFYSTCLEGEMNIHQNPLGTYSTDWVDVVDVIKNCICFFFSYLSSLPPYLRQSVYL